MHDKKITVQDIEIYKSLADSNIDMLSTHLLSACRFNEYVHTKHILDNYSDILPESSLRNALLISVSNSASLDMMNFFFSKPYFQSILADASYTNEIFNKAVSHGYFPIAKFLLKHDLSKHLIDFKMITSKTIYKLLDNATENNIKKLFSYNENNQYIDISLLNSSAINILCQNNSYSLIDYFLHSKDLKKNLSTDIFNNSLLYCACAYGSVETLDFLINDHKLKHILDIHAGNDTAFVIAIENNRNNICEYILKNNKLNTFSFESALNIFQSACIYNNKDVLEYLIFDYNIPRSSHLDKYLEEDKHYEIRKMFEVRELKNKLKINTEKEKKQAIKI